jgi:hypothetical protein
MVFQHTNEIMHWNEEIKANLILFVNKKHYKYKMAKIMYSMNNTK